MAARVFTSLTDPAVVSLLQNGAVGVIPTDTVYGLVAKADQSLAVEKLYQTKPRELQPGTIIGATLPHLEKLGFLLTELERASSYWPNPVSVVLNATHVPPYLKKTRDSLAVRIPLDNKLTTLLKQTGPLMTTSANAPGQPTATTLSSAMHYFGDTIDFYVDAGDLGDRPPSTIIGFSPDGSTVVYRSGAVVIDNL